METITHHVQHRFNTAKAEFEQNQKILNDIVRALQIKNPSLIAQILKQLKNLGPSEEIDWDGNEVEQEQQITPEPSESRFPKGKALSGYQMKTY